MRRCTCGTRAISPGSRWRRSNVAGPAAAPGLASTPRLAVADRRDRRVLTAGLLQRIPIVLHACLDLGPNRGRPRERGDHPTAGVIGVSTAHCLGRRRTALLQVGLVFFRRAIALDGRIVRGRAPTDGKQQGRNYQTGSERSHAADGRKPGGSTPAPRRRRVGRQTDTPGNGSNQRHVSRARLDHDWRLGSNLRVPS
jgi:hypothetical protein